MAYDGGPINQSTSGGNTDLFGGPSMFGQNNSGWVVATGGGNASATPSAGVPWVTIALAGVAIVGLLVWKSKR